MTEQPYPEKVIVWLRKDMHGNWFVKRAFLEQHRLEGQTICEDDKFVEYHLKEEKEGEG